MKFFRQMVAVAMFVVPSVALADVDWRITGVFDDGTTLTGSFAINQYGFLSAAALTTMPDGAFAGRTYTSADQASNTATAIDFQPSYQNDLHIVFASSLSQPSTNPVVSGYECVGSYGCFEQQGGTIRTLVSGVATVPEPASWALFVTGFAAAGMALRSRRAAPALQ